MEKAIFIDKVRRAINEGKGTDDTSTFSTELDTLIADKAEDALVLLTEICPEEQLDNNLLSILKIVYIPYSDIKTNAVVSPLPNGLYKVSIDKPSDFVRFGSASLTDWHFPTYEMRSVSDKRYQLESSPIKGVGSTTRKPSAYVSNNDIQFYSSTYDADAVTKMTDAEKALKVGTMTYYKKVGWTTLDGKTTLPIPTLLENACVYLCASLTCDSLGETELSNALMKTATELLKINNG